jgi:hypothetical protein
MIFFGVFSWAREKRGETTSRRIIIERSFFDTMGFFYSRPQ